MICMHGLDVLIMLSTGTIDPPYMIMKLYKRTIDPPYMITKLCNRTIDPPYMITKLCSGTIYSQNVTIDPANVRIIGAM